MKWTYVFQVVLVSIHCALAIYFLQYVEVIILLSLNAHLPLLKYALDNATEKEALYKEVTELQEEVVTANELLEALRNKLEVAESALKTHTDKIKSAFGDSYLKSLIKK